MKVYKDSGVDIKAGEKVKAAIKNLVRSTCSRNVLMGVGGFSGLFQLKKYTQPVLSACTDGVGTKLKIAFKLNRHDTVGIDLVAMCVNDLITSGARPLFFLDYLSASNLKKVPVKEIIKGMVRGCREAGCALLGGETAQMPQFYQGGEYDLSGFSVGIVEKGKIIDGKRIRPGDKIIGLSSNGLHSNGYSLVRRFIPPRFWPGMQRILLRPTKIYVKIIQEILKYFPVKGIAHITGGGIPGNLVRILPPGAKAVIKKGSWPVPPIFKILQHKGIDEKEMFGVFNMGIGMVIVSQPQLARKILTRISGKEKAYIIGEVVKGKREVEVR